MAEAIHGGRVHEAARRLGVDPASILDFSANLNPLGPPEGMIAALHSALPHALSAYPDTDAPAVCELLCKRHRTMHENLVLGHGGAALLLLALRALAPRRVLVPQPCFSEQPRALAAVGAEMAPLALPEMRLRLEDLDPDRFGCDAVLLTNPHNPTGQLIPKADLRRWIKAHPHAALLVDEAFMDYAEAESVLPEVLARPKTVVLRSLTKFFAMPGLRVGYAYADVSTAARMRELQEGWPVGQLELVAAEAALRDEAYAARTLELFHEEAPRWAQALRGLGLRVFPSAGPYVLVQLPGSFGSRLAELLAQDGILVRTCAAWPGLDDRFVRLAVKDADAHERLLARLHHHLATLA
jgi:threonine-phosphate decarboxylase